MFVISGFQAFQSILTPELYTVITAILTALATYFKTNPSQKYGDS